MSDKRTPEQIIKDLGHLKKGAKKLFQKEGPNQGDMWFFELYHALDEAADMLAAQSRAENAE